MRARGIVLALLLALAPLATPPRAEAVERAAIIVTPGSARTFRVALQRFADRSAVPSEERAERFRDAVGHALDFSGVFQLLDRKAFLGPTDTPVPAEPPVCADWGAIGSDVLVSGELRTDPAHLSAEFEVWDVARCVKVVGKRYRQAPDDDPARIANRVADDVVEAFIGLRGVSSTEIAFVSDRGGNPEVWVMDADGSHQRPATANRSINAFPNWSPDGDAILYTSYRFKNRPHLFLSSRARRRPGMVLPQLDGEVSQYRGVFGPAGERLAVVLSRAGSTDVYRARADGSRLRRLTNSDSIEISPSWSPDGTQLAFVSDRSGAPQVYLMDADGGNVRRLTFEGTYNTNPAWSPDGRWIAYESRLESQFDIWLIDVEGSVNVPLVDHPRSDEGPSWAPNSRKLAFSSTRRGRADLYVIDVSGDNLRRLTRGGGNNKSPAWGPFPR